MVKFIKIFCALFLLALASGVTVLIIIVNKYGSSLPNYQQLRSYQPPLTTRLYSNNGKLLKEYAEEKRLFVPYEVLPATVIYAFISAEDKNFFEHSGVDFHSLLRAVLYNVYAYFTNRQMVGGSTITQQVVKNLLLTNEKTIDRKIKEAILSFRLTKTISKEKVLELYLNQIYFGNKAYGIAAAALNYFGKAVENLTIEEAAMLAALPKAPSSISPYRNPTRALTRRNWVIDRMAEDGHISRIEAEQAKIKPIALKSTTQTNRVDAEFFAEAVRRQLVDQYGEEAIMHDGLIVRTTISQRLQKFAEQTLQLGLETYDQRHGYRGALGTVSLQGKVHQQRIDEQALPEVLQAIQAIEISRLYKDSWQRAIVTGVRDRENELDILVLNPQCKSDGTKIFTEDDLEEVTENQEAIKCQPYNYGVITLDGLKWARSYIDENTLGATIEKVSQVAQVGDVVMVISDPKATQQRQNSTQEMNGSGKELDQLITALSLPVYKLQQIPEINGALVAMDPHNGRILAMMGGYIDTVSQFNRVTQAKRQPGSTAKPFAYLAALENGFTPADIIMDEEIELYQGDDKPPYKPRNDTRRFYGPTTLRVGLEKSRNVVTIRLAHEVGLAKVAEVIRRFGIDPRPKRIYSMVIGSLETTLLQMTKAYAMLVNGGYKIEANLIDKIQDRHGKTIFIRDNAQCAECNLMESKIDNITEIPVPQLADHRVRIVDAGTAYQMVSMLEGVVLRGTGWRARAIKKVIGGKTGTTNDSYDSWFIGFSPDLVVGVYVGFDSPRSLGSNEYGATIAAPIFVNFMINALEHSPSITFRVPPEIKLVKTDLDTGLPPTPNTPAKRIIYEAFKINQTNDLNSNIQEQLEQNEFEENNSLDMFQEMNRTKGQILNSNEQLSFEEGQNSDLQPADGLKLQETTETVNDSYNFNLEILENQEPDMFNHDTAPTVPAIPTTNSNPERRLLKPVTPPVDDFESQTRYIIRRQNNPNLSPESNGGSLIQMRNREATPNTPSPVQYFKQTSNELEKLLMNL